MKGEIPMLEGTYTFTDPGLFSSGYPVIIEQENGDGTYQGRFDLDKMSNTQKFMAGSEIKSNAINEIMRRQASATA